MEESTRPARTRPPQAVEPAGLRRRRHPIRTTLILGMVMIPVVCALTFAAAAYASTATIRLPPVNRQTLGRIASSLLPTPPSPIPAPSQTPLPTFQPPTAPAPLFATAAPASPTSLPSSTPTPSETPTETPTATEAPTLTATFTLTPTFTATPTASLTPTASQTPSPPPTATRTPTATSVPPTATNPPAPTATSPPPSATSLPPSATPDPSCTAALNASYEITLLGLINQERVDQGLPPYNSNSQLQAAARGHSIDMACNGYFSHTGSDGSNVGQRVNAEGYSWSWVGENIYAGTSATPQSAFTWWMNSAPHQANLLNSNYVDIGIGYVYEPSSPYGGYFTTVFAKP